MKIFNKLEDDLLIITPNEIKESILKKINKLYNIKFFTIEQLRDNLLYHYHQHTLFYISNKYHIIPSNAEILMNNLYYIDDYYHNNKLDYLYNIKKDLHFNNYLIKNRYFNTYLSNKKVYIYGYPITKELNKLIEIISKYTVVEVINEDSINKLIPVYAYDTIENEVVGCAEQISLLIKDGVNINNIYIYLPTNEYTSVVNRIFNIFNIPISLKNRVKISSFPMIKTFLDLLTDVKVKDSQPILDKLIVKYPLNNETNLKLYNNIITILNKYYDLDITLIDLKEVIIHELGKISLVLDEYANCVQEIELNSYLSNDQDYVFVLGLNQDILPMVYKDDDYLTDDEKNILGIDNSNDLTNISKDNFINIVNSIKNIYLSYKLKGYSQEFLPSNLIENTDLFMTIAYKYQFTNNAYNNYLLANSYDLYYKYNMIDQFMETLNNKTNNFQYRTYNNQYQPISFDLINQYLENKLVLSYSSLDTFYKCQFAFYLKHILKINKPVKNDRAIKIGTAFHQILCEVYQNNFKDIDEIVDRNLSKQLMAVTKKDLFYNKKYGAFIKTIIRILQQRESNFDTSYLEKSFFVNKKSVLKVTIMGVIDKVLTLTIDDNTYVIVIDYKTGYANIDLNKVIYGLDMQLLMYLYLLKYSKDINNFHFAGAYINPIMPNLMNAEENKTYNDLIVSSIKLDGYTINDPNIVSKIDCHYLDNSFIKSIRVKNDGTFYSNAKVYDTTIIDRLLDIVNINIEKSITAIENSDFSINPKRIGMEKFNDITGCRYCEYYDICYHRPDNVVNLKEYKQLEFLGGENNEMD